MAKKVWTKTNFPGVRFREHPTRKNGIRRDQYFTIRYKRAGKDHEEGLGWASEDWTAAKAYDHLKGIKENIKTGEGVQSLAEKRDLEAQRRAEAESERAREEQETITLKSFFEGSYLPHARNNKKPRTCDTEEHLFRNWIKPVVGEKALKDISAFDCERIKKQMRGAEKSERTVEYALAVLRQVFTVAGKLKLYAGPNPLREVDKPKFDNRKQRFLTKEETTLLMDELKTRSRQLYQIAMISLHAGLRFGEIAGLAWQDIDMGRGLFLLRDTKNAESRFAFMTEALKQEIMTMTPGGPSELVFKDKTGGKIQSVSATFDRVVESLGLNTGITDRRMKFTFHNLRHSFASNLVSIGIDLFRVQQLLGHKTPKMTLRYSHMRPDDLRSAIDQMEKAMNQNQGAEIVNLKK